MNQAETTLSSTASEAADLLYEAQLRGAYIPLPAAEKTSLASRKQSVS